jgi:hypothetical protein
VIVTSITTLVDVGVGVGVLVAVAVGVGVLVDVGVGVGVLVDVGDGVGVGVAVGELVGVGDGVGVGVGLPSIQIICGCKLLQTPESLFATTLICVVPIGILSTNKVCPLYISLQRTF